MPTKNEQTMQYTLGLDFEAAFDLEDRALWSESTEEFSELFLSESGQMRSTTRAVEISSPSVVNTSRNLLLKIF